MAMSDFLKYFGNVGANPFAASTVGLPQEINRDQQETAKLIKDLTGVDVYKRSPKFEEIDINSLPQRKGQFSLMDAMSRPEPGPPRPPSIMPQEIDLAGLPQLRERAAAAPVAPVAPKRDSERLGLMLYALGGALKGDKNFMQNTLALQNMQEGKKKDAERKKNFQEMLKKIPKDTPMYNLAKAMGEEKSAELAEVMYKSSLPSDPSKQIKREELNVLVKLKKVDGDIEKLTNYEKQIYKDYIKKDSSQGILQQLGLISNIEPNQAPLTITKIQAGQ